MIVYIGEDYKCHASPADSLVPVEDSFFYGKCDTFIEGYCYDTSKGYTQIYPWKPCAELDAAQREYERQKLAEYEVELAELDALILDYQYNRLTEEL